MLRLLRILVVFVSLAFAFGLARDARAGDTAAAQALFDQGKKLMGEKKYAEACAKFEESQKQDPGLGTQTNLAICYEAMGRTASAWSLYLDVASQAKATNQADREKKARAAAQALEPKLSKLTIVVASPAADLEVKRNGEPVGQASWGTPIPVDPGQIKISAVAPSRKQWETSITVDKPGEQTVKVPELERGQPPVGYYPAPTATATNGGPGYSPPPAYPPPAGQPQPQLMKRRSKGLFGGGIAAISVGSLTTVVGLAWLGIAAGFDGESIGAPAATLGVGLALLGGGIAMVVIGGKKVPVKQGEDASAPLVSPMPEVRVGLGSAQLKWQF
jgi:hypothetical protein